MWWWNTEVDFWSDVKTDKWEGRETERRNCIHANPYWWTPTLTPHCQIHTNLCWKTLTHTSHQPLLINTCTYTTQLSTANTSQHIPKLPTQGHLPWFVRFAHVGILVPATVGVMGAAQTVIIAAMTHEQVHLTNPYVRWYIKGLVLGVGREIVLCYIIEADIILGSINLHFITYMALFCVLVE